MKMKLFFRTFWLVIAMIVIIPVMLNSKAEAAGGNSNEGNRTYSNIWILETDEEKDSGGSRTLEIETYIKNNLGEYQKRDYIQDVSIEFSNNPGETAVTLEDGYILNHMELWSGGSKEAEGSAAININIGKNSSKTLKLYTEQKYNDAGYENNGSTSGGEVTLNKTVTPEEDKANEYDLEFSVQGETITQGKKADIVLVLDKSGSMEDPISGKRGKSKAEVLEEAANRFIDGVLPTGGSGDNRVAIVTYSDEAQIIQPFTSDNSAAKNAYKNFKNMVGGGTNSEAGFIMARQVFSSSFVMGAERYVIYMTDGEPTQYYNIDGEVVGLGNEYDADAKDAAVSEANLLKEFGGGGVEIYTVGFAPSNTAEMEALLNPATFSYQKAYYYAKTADDLTNIYGIIADTIIDTIATETKITDTLPAGFEFMDESLPEDVTVREDGVMLWNLGSITSSEASRNVRIRYTGENYGIKYANEDAEIEYRHALSPNTVTRGQFDNPLAVITPNIAEYVYYTNKGENIIITPPDITSVNEAGSDYAISDLKIKVDGGTQKPNGEVTDNADNTEITYVPQSQGYTEDSFSYIVYFTISSNNDPKNLLEGTSKTYEKKVNVIVNPHPDVNLTINYFEVLNGENRLLSVNGAVSVVRQLPKNGFIDEFAPAVTGYDLIDISYDGIINPVLAGKRLTGQAGKNNIEINYYYERDNSIVFDNILQKNSMYANNDLKPIGNNHEPFNLVSGVSYRFGFKFQAGQNVEKINVAFTGDTDKFILSNFCLYDDNGNFAGGPADGFNLFSSLINANHVYTVTYNLKPIDSGASLNALISNAIPQDGSIPVQIRINSIGTLELE